MNIDRVKLRWLLDSAIPACKPVKDFYQNWRLKGLEYAVNEFERHGIVNRKAWDRVLDYLQEDAMFRLKKSEGGEGGVAGTVVINDQTFPVKVVRDKDGHLDLHAEGELPDGNALVTVEGAEYKVKVARGRFISK